MLREFAQFGRHYNECLKKFANEINKHKDTFIQSVNNPQAVATMRQKGGLQSFVDNNYFGYGSTKNNKKSIQQPWPELDQADEDEIAAI